MDSKDVYKRQKEYGVIDRVMFASDYVAHGYDLFSENPTEDFKRWIDYVRIDLNRICETSGWPTFTQDEIDGILYKNAARLYSCLLYTSRCV